MYLQKQNYLTIDAWIIKLVPVHVYSSKWTSWSNTSHKYSMGLTSGEFGSRGAVVFILLKRFPYNLCCVTGRIANAIINCCHREVYLGFNDLMVSAIQKPQRNPMFLNKSLPKPSDCIRQFDVSPQCILVPLLNRDKDTYIYCNSAYSVESETF